MKKINIVIKITKSRDSETPITIGRIFDDKEKANAYITSIINETKENKQYPNEVNCLDAFGFYYNGTNYCEEYTRIELYEDVSHNIEPIGNTFILILNHEKNCNESVWVNYGCIGDLIGKYAFEYLKTNNSVSINKNDNIYSIYLNEYDKVATIKVLDIDNGVI